MDLHPDFKDLLAEFARCAVDYAVVGGYAVSYHARPRATEDLDLLVAGNGENLRRVADALTAFGAPVNVVDAARSLAADEIVYLGVPPVRIDIMRSADGIDPDEVIARAELVELDGMRTRIAAIDDLITNKRASGRPQDLADVALLERVKMAVRSR